MDDKKMRMLRTITAFLGLAAIAGCATNLATRTDPSAWMRGNVDGSSDTTVCPEYVESLILRLRSPNRNPNPDGEPFLIPLPDDYDSAAQKGVEIARKELIALGKGAFPVLIKHLNDKGYSLSRSTSIYRGFSVGEVCFMIIRDQVDAGMRYKARDGADGGSYPDWGYFSQYCNSKWFTGNWFTKAGMRRWWKENQELSLREMRMEALRWRIQREREIGFPDEDDKKHYLDPLVEELDRLTRAQP